MTPPNIFDIHTHTFHLFNIRLIRKLERLGLIVYNPTLHYSSTIHLQGSQLVSHFKKFSDDIWTEIFIMEQYWALTVHHKIVDARNVINIKL